MASPSISSQIRNGESTASLSSTQVRVRSSFASLRQSLSSGISSFKTKETTSGYTGEDIPLSENVGRGYVNRSIDYEAEGEGGIGSSSNHDADASRLPPTGRQSSGYQRQIDDDPAQADGGSVDDEEGEEWVEIGIRRFRIL
ncbi:1795_t:CDS:2 [Acaulospora colombiana]|uniref:1795_t:CDS:1 n=1 Tax=Acaulospora colombiana TaxID=27376 RepID=A0ACA9L5U9_9GLOM|nr:1795_t:CDS:2 [Acaulospora colombiana]